MYKMTQKILILCAWILLGMSVGAQTLKIASLAPEATPWGQGLNQMASEWAKATNGRVRLKIFHGGVVGNEVDVIRKMRLGQIHGTTSSPIGLNTMVPPMWGLVIPGIIQTGEELDFILEEFEDELNTLFQNAGYEILTWSNSGWLKFFTTDQIQSPDDLRGMKISTANFDDGFNTILRNLGMQTISLDATEILTGLNSGLLNAIVYAPLAVAGFQWFSVANNMLDLQIAPFFGAVVMDSRSWNRIPEQYHEELRAIAQRIGKEMEDQLNTLEQEGIELMQTYGLSVNEPRGSDLEDWYDLFAEARKDLDDRYFSDPSMAKILAALEEFRR